MDEMTEKLNSIVNPIHQSSILTSQTIAYILSRSHHPYANKTESKKIISQIALLFN